MGKPLIVSVGKVPEGKRRSGKWAALRKNFLRKFPACALCGRKTHLEVHHIIPFHLRPELELDEANLISLCENKKSGVNCHLLFGHLGSYLSFNPNVKADVSAWNVKLKDRP